MKVLKQVTYYYNSDQYEQKTQVVAVAESMTPREILEKFLTIKYPKKGRIFSNWTEYNDKETNDISFLVKETNDYDPEGVISTFKVMDFKPLELE